MAYALSLRQPWAELIVSKKKTIELRTWNTKFRGEFYIHASKKIERKECLEYGLNPDKLISGALIGKCKLIDVKRYDSIKALKKDALKHYASNYEVPCYGFILRNCKRINPIEYKGRLGFFKIKL